MQSTLSLTLDLTQKKGYFTDTTDYNAIGVDVNTLGATGSVVVYFQGDVVGSPLAIDLASGGTTTPLFDLELDVNGEVANGNYTAVYTVDFAFNSVAALTGPDQITISSLGANYQGFTNGSLITASVDLPTQTEVLSAQDVAGDLVVTLNTSVVSTLGSPQDITLFQQFVGFSWVYAGCTLVEAQSGLVADCDYGDFGTFTVSNETNTTGITINSLTADINYPGWTNQPVITVTSLPYTNNQLATGTYSVTLTQEIEKVQNDGLIIVYTASSIQEFKVSCIGSLCGLNDCLENLRAAHEAELLRNRISKYQVFVDNILIYYTEAQSYRSCGQMDEYRATVAKIEAQLDASGCDCGCCDENQYIWVQNTSPAASSIMQDIIDLQNDVATLQVDVATIQNDAVLTANNGLTKSANNVALGGALTQDTTIDAGTLYKLIIEKSSITNSVSSGLELITKKAIGPGGNGLGSSILFGSENSVSIPVYTAGIQSKIVNAITGEGTIEIGVSDGSNVNTQMEISSDGEVTMNNYGDGTFTGSPTYILSVDVDGKVIETEVDNGLTKSSGSIQLGGTLLNDTTIIGDGKNLSIHSGALNVSDFRIENYARLIVTSINSSTAPYYTYQNNSYPHHISYSTSSSSPTTGELRTFITNSGVPQANFGCEDTLNLEYSGGNSTDALKISTTWDTNPAVIHTGKYQITLRENNSNRLEVLTLRGTGAAQLDQYGDGNFTGTATYNLAVDASGNVIEVAGGGGGPLVYVGKIVGTGGSATLNEIYNNTGATFSIGNIFTGYYEINSSTPVMTSNAVAFVQSTQLGFLMANVFSGTLGIESYNASGSPSNSIVASAIVKIEIYP